MDSKQALEMDRDEAYEKLEMLECFCEELQERFDYFATRGHVNPTKQLPNMMLSMLIMLMDKLQAEGLFKEPGGWRSAFDYYLEEDCLPENYPSDEK